MYTAVSSQAWYCSFKPEDRALEMRQADTVAEQWRLRLWCGSADCQHLVLILLTLKSKLRLSEILAVEVPSFLMLTTKDAFLEAVGSPYLSDQILQTAVIQFLATWRHQAYATISELRADPIIARIADELLPQSLTFLEWLERRMRRDIELNGDSDSAIVHCTQHGGRLVVSAYEQINSVGSHRAAT